MNKFITSALVAVVLATVTSAKPTADESTVISAGLLTDEIINLQIKENAVYRVTHEELLALDIDLTGFKANDIAISFKGEAVERHIAGIVKDKWTSESTLEFKGEKAQGLDALYLEANNYRLSINRGLVVESEGIEPATTKELVFESNNRYSMTAPGEDPFYDAWFYVMSVGKRAALTRTFDLSEVPQGDTKIKVSVDAKSNVTHHLQVSINGEPVAEDRAEGWIDMPISTTIDGSTLHEGSNTVTITAIGENNAYDIYTYDKFEISYEGEAQESKTAQLSLEDEVSKKSITAKQGTNYVIVSHPMFMTEALDNYISQKAVEGWKTHLVNVEDIYNAYGYGMATPEAIESYLKDAEGQGVTHVQLVGAATYDYHDYLGLGSVNFIGSLYAQTGTDNKYTPCDACLVADETGLPKLAIGRWPVRTAEGLEAVVNKSLLWKDSGQSQSHSALFIADKKDEALNLDFSKQMEPLVQQFQTTGMWNDMTHVYLDAYIATNNGDKTLAVEAARNDITQSLNNGASITMYSGHSSQYEWSFDGLLKQSDIVDIANEGRTTLALPLACFTTYADSPGTHTLAHQFLVAENGAVAVYGAATLSKFTANGKSAAKVIDYLLKGETIGDAVRRSKVDLGVNYMDVIRNSNLLGDVTVTID